MAARVAASVRVWALTDVGKVRDHNEDAYLVDSELGLFVVADGMGGHAAGEVASRMAVDAVTEAVRRQASVLKAYLDDPEQTVHRKDLLTLLESAVQAGCSTVYEESRRDIRKRGMGTTIEVLLVVGTKAFAAHVGDSRIYLLRQDGVHQLTEDHSLINELIRRGRMSPERLATVEQKNAVTRALGPYPSVEVDVFDFDLLAGDRIILCTDGLSNHLEPQDLSETLENIDLDAAAQALVDLANARGGRDNITAIVVAIDAAEDDAEALAARFQLRFDHLRSTPLFRYLDYKETVRVLGAAEQQSFTAGALVVTEGEAGDALYLLLTGAVEVLANDRQIAKLLAGEHFGELALIDKSPRSASVRTLEPCELLVLRRTEFFDILRNEHGIAVKLLWSFLGVLAGRLRDANKSGIHPEVLSVAFGDDELTAKTLREDLPDT